MRAERTLPWLAGLLAIAIAAGAISLPPANAQTPTVKLMVLGETHGTRDVTKALVNVAASKGATGCVCPGDFIYGHWDSSPTKWREMMRPVMGQMMPAQGNHDWPWSDWSGLFPEGKPYFAKDVGGTQFISLNTEHSLAPGSSQRAWLDARLAEREPEQLKVVFLHRPWWLPDGAVHPASEFQSKNGLSGSSMDALMVKHGVDLVVSAHEKNYQHSLRDGVHYLVAGGGTSEFYSMGYSLPGAVKRLTSNVVTTMDITPTSLTLKSYDRYASKIEEWTIGGSAGSTSPDPGSDSGSGTATFTPKGGSEWWVQVKVSGSPTRVEAMDTGGAWTPLTLRSWGDWAGSFRVEPGHLVTFRATLPGGAVATSCAYSWPAGGCAQPAPTPAPAPSPATGTASFTPKGGNEWWVQVAVGGSPSKVDAMDTGGAWTPLTLRSWGDWAGSFRVEAGHLVTFRATLGDGSVATSCAYAWPAGACSGAATPAPTGTFAATFSNVRGNLWWVEADIRASGATLAGADARVDGGAWTPLAKRDWGSWAESMRAPAGSTVELRARAADGQVATSGAYAWPPS